MEKGEIIIYKSEDGQAALEVKLDNNTVWLGQEQIGQLFERDRSVITKHISNIFKEKELEKESNVQKMHIANSDKPIMIYSLDVIISVGRKLFEVNAAS